MATKKVERPTASLKDYMLRVRMDKETVDKLDEICEKENTNRSEVVRNGIEERYQRMGRNDKNA